MMKYWSAWAGLLCAGVMFVVGCGDSSSPAMGPQFDAGLDADISAVAPGTMDAADADASVDAQAGEDASVSPTPCEPTDLLEPKTCGAGQACRAQLDAENNLVRLCSAANETGTQAARCTTDAECAAGFTCVPAGPDVRVCAKYCDEANPCPGATALCFPYRIPKPDSTDPSDMVDAEIGVCTTACDFVRGASSVSGVVMCPSGTDCEAVRFRGYADWTTTCMQTGTVAIGQPCSSRYECVSGATCAVPAGEQKGACRRWCDYNAPDRDALCAGQRCLPSGNVVLGGRRVGMCI